ncbi:hypothetical protein [Flavihumibacter petaseus]|uniref:Two-component histidine kinase n=1 Tax=Flavihumibacter petaseus NBRC 106054 TaxID=1220578 RepID=A0A0E9MVN7_9BACT|nr:hypothetical protein [Flavihumibacter petaseus]GAO41476.1 hypothetical protein FPE01S_01_04890 [Flavihumibacter petaseus NBRC 106054]
MGLKQLLFAQGKKPSLKRHLLFWMVITTYYYCQSISPNCTKGLPSAEVFRYAGVSVLCFLPACVIGVFVFLRWLKPLLTQKKYLLFGSGCLSTAIMLQLLNYFTAVEFFRMSCHCDTGTIIFERKFAMAFINTQLAIFLGVLALALHLLVKQHQVQINNLALATATTAKKTDLAKAALYPAYLMDSLESIQKALLRKEEEAGIAILTLSEKLSNRLYGSGVLMPEEHEGTNLIELEKRLDHDFA